MSRLNSFYLSPEEWPTAVGNTVVLEGAEAKHMGTVLRTEKNQTVRLFDGQGRTGLFVVIDSGRNKAVLQATELAEHPAPATGLTLAIGWGKSKRRNYLFEKTVELQGNGIVFWQAKRSQGRVPDQIKATWSDKCIQAAKQCGSVYLPELKTCVGGVDTLIQLADVFDHCYIAWESDQISSPLSPFMLSKGRSLVVIGPEGGFDDAEAEKLIEASFKAVTLGRSILRWETAAMYCLSLAMFGGQEV